MLKIMLKFSRETGIRIIFLSNLARIWQKKKKKSCSTCFDQTPDLGYLFR